MSTPPIRGPGRKPEPQSLQNARANVANLQAEHERAQHVAQVTGQKLAEAHARLNAELEKHAQACAADKTALDQLHAQMDEHAKRGVPPKPDKDGPL
jgi:hypothetical protein